MKYMCSLFTVDDMDEAKEFYIKVLGQKIKYDFGESVTFEGDFTIHDREHFGNLLKGLKIKMGSNSSELYFESDDLKGFEDKLERENIEFIHKMEEQPWRQRVLRFYDPSRNIIEVGETLEHLAYRLWTEGKKEAEIEKIINMSKEFIRIAINKFAN